MYVSADIAASDLPKPTGFRLLIGIPDVENKTKGGILLPDQLRDLEKTASVVGQVLDMGSEAYSDKEKFPAGPWCKTGDFIMLRSYTGTRFKVNDREYRLINDDTVEAVVADPRVIKRA